MKQILQKTMLLVGVMAGSMGATAQLLQQAHPFPYLETSLPKHMMQSSLHQERPTIMQSRLTAITTQEHDGAAYKRVGDSLRIYGRGLLSTELDFRQYFFLSYGIDVAEPVVPLLPRATLLQEVPLVGDSLVSYEANVSGTAFEEPRYRTALSYDDDDHVTNQLDQEYTGGTWVNDWQYDYTRDASARITEVMERSWDGSAWDNESRTTYTYGGSGGLTEEADQTWSGTEWVNEDKYIYEYDSDGNCTTVIIQDGMGASWENDVRNLLTYNDDGHVSEYVSQDWIGGAWENDRKFYFTYTTAGKITTYIEQSWSAGAWENEQRRTYTFTDGRVTLLLLESFDGSDWNNEAKANYVYDGDDDNTEIIVQNWDLVGSSWENESKMIMEYNDYQQATSLSMQTWNAGEFWESTVGAMKYVLYYEVYDDGNGIESEGQPIEVRIYPNPANELLHISIPTVRATPISISIFDINGRICLTQSVTSFSGQTTMDVSRLPAGSYILKTNTRTGTSSKAFQVVK